MCLSGLYEEMKTLGWPTTKEPKRRNQMSQPVVLLETNIYILLIWRGSTTRYEQSCLSIKLLPPSTRRTKVLYWPLKPLLSDNRRFFQFTALTQSLSTYIVMRTCLSTKFKHGECLNVQCIYETSTDCCQVMEIYQAPSGGIGSFQKQTV